MDLFVQVMAKENALLLTLGGSDVTIRAGVTCFSCDVGADWPKEVAEPPHSPSAQRDGTRFLGLRPSCLDPRACRH